MLSQEENQLLTQTGPGTPGGDLFRRYWHPVAMSEELLPDGAPLNVRILSEELVLFRDDQGRPGLLGLHCAHRGTDLSYGRCEDGGLRCVYHGWLYDIHGRCLEQPGEPRGSQYYKEIRHLSYPCQEAGGLIFTYMGSDEPPLLPAYEWLNVPENHSCIMKFFYGCNYLQGDEGNYDQAHLDFLHRFTEKPVVAAQMAPDLSFVLGDSSPVIEMEETDFGLRIFTTRDAGSGKKYGRVDNFVFPNVGTFATIAGEHAGICHVPIDDTSHWAYMIDVNQTVPFDKEWIRQQRAAEWAPDHRLIRDKSNRYLQDREAMKTGSFAGIGIQLEVQDVFGTENQGAIQDRTRENLAYTDRSIIAVRKLLLRAIRDVQEGHEAPHVVRDPAANRFDHLRSANGVMPSSTDWKTEWVAYAKGHPVKEE